MNELNELNEEKFRKFWEETKLIRTYRARLPSYEDIGLPYVFLSPHPNLKRVFVKKGKIHIKKPMIIIPGVNAKFEGFEHESIIERQITILTRMINLPYYKYTNKLVAEEVLDYGQPEEIAERYNKKMDRENDKKTGLIIGELEGWSISLARYSFEAVVKSAPENIQELLERMKKRGYPPIGPEEKIPENPWDLFRGNR